MGETKLESHMLGNEEQIATDKCLDRDRSTKLKPLQYIYILNTGQV
jgi:hypothetical protein